MHTERMERESKTPYRMWYNLLCCPFVSLQVQMGQKDEADDTAALVMSPLIVTMYGMKLRGESDGIRSRVQKFPA